MDTQIIICLKEIIQLMTEDEDVTRFLFNLTPSCYADARFIDWFKPYL